MFAPFTEPVHLPVERMNSLGLATRLMFVSAVDVPLMVIEPFSFLFQLKPFAEPSLIPAGLNLFAPVVVVCSLAPYTVSPSAFAANASSACATAPETSPTSLFATASAAAWFAASVAASIGARSSGVQ